MFQSTTSRWLSVMRLRLPHVSRLLLLDGHSLAYRAFFALPVENFSTPTGQLTNAVYGFTSMLINVLRDEAPTHVAVAFDVSRQTFRTEQYAEYKADGGDSPMRVHRAGAADARRCSPRCGFRSVEKEGFEADDVIATLTAEAHRAGMEVRDLHRRPRLAPAGRDAVTVLYPVRGVSDVADDAGGGAGEVLVPP